MFFGQFLHEFKHDWKRIQRLSGPTSQDPVNICSDIAPEIGQVGIVFFMAFPSVPSVTSQRPGGWCRAGRTPSIGIDSLH
jgi:hypothetical protein